RTRLSALGLVSYSELLSPSHVIQRGRTLNHRQCSGRNIPFAFCPLRHKGPPSNRLTLRRLRRKKRIGQNGAIELRRGRGKCLSHLQKALRHDLRTGENRGMVDERGFEPPASSLRTVGKIS